MSIWAGRMARRARKPVMGVDAADPRRSPSCRLLGWRCLVIRMARSSRVWQVCRSRLNTVVDRVIGDAG